LGLLGGLSTVQLNCCLPHMEEKRREKEEHGMHVHGIGPKSLHFLHINNKLES